MGDLLVTGGRVVDPANGVDGHLDVLIRNGLVAGVERPGAFAGLDGVGVLDAKGCVVCPGTSGCACPSPGAGADTQGDDCDWDGGGGGGWVHERGGDAEYRAGE